MPRIKVNNEVSGILSIIKGYLTIKKGKRVTNDEIIKEALLEYAKKNNIHIKKCLGMLLWLN